MPQAGQARRDVWRRTEALVLACAALGAGLASSGAPLWFQQSTAKKLRHRPKEEMLLHSLAEMLMPEEPAEDLVREFSAQSEVSEPRALPPALATYGVLEDKDAALFVDYDGSPSHLQPAGKAADVAKTEALLRLAPPGSYVVRVAHEQRGLEVEGNCLEVVVEPWQLGDESGAKKALRRTADALLQHLPLRRDVQQTLLCFPADGDALAEVGMSKEEWARILQEHPHIVGYNLSVGNLATSAEELGLSPLHLARIIARRQQFLGLGQSSDLQSMVSELGEMGFSQHDIVRTFKRWPSNLNVDSSFSFKPHADFLSEVGLSNGQWIRVLSVHPGLLSMDIDTKLRPVVNFLQEQGLNPSHVVGVITAFPRVFDYISVVNENPWGDVLREGGLSQGQVARVFAKFPAIFSLSAEALQARIDMLQKVLHADKDAEDALARTICNYPRVLDFSEDQVESTLGWLRRFGFREADSAKVVQAAPSVLGRSVDRLQSTVRCLKEVGLSKSEVAGVLSSCPQALAVHVKSILQPKMELLLQYFSKEDLLQRLHRSPKLLYYAYDRLAVRLRDLKKRELLEAGSYIMSMSDSAFGRWVDAKAQEDEKAPEAVFS